jgi:hypothetical protein
VQLNNYFLNFFSLNVLFLCSSKEQTLLFVAFASTKKKGRFCGTSAVASSDLRAAPCERASVRAPTFPILVSFF